MCHAYNIMEIRTHNITVVRSVRQPFNSDERTTSWYKARISNCQNINLWKILQMRSNLLSSITVDTGLNSFEIPTSLLDSQTGNYNGTFVNCNVVGKCSRDYWFFRSRKRLYNLRFSHWLSHTMHVFELRFRRSITGRQTSLNSRLQSFSIFLPSSPRLPKTLCFFARPTHTKLRIFTISKNCKITACRKGILD